MSVNRRQFLASLAVAAVAPGVLSRAAVVSAAPRGVDYVHPSLLPLLQQPLLSPEANAAHWARQCGPRGNPAWVFYHLVAQRYDPEHVDLDSVRHVAALCDEPVTVPIS